METAKMQKWWSLRSYTSRRLSCATSNIPFAIRRSLSTFFSEANTRIFLVSMMHPRCSRTGVASQHPLISCRTSPNRPNSLPSLRTTRGQSLLVYGRPNGEGPQAKSSMYGGTPYPSTSRKCCTSRLSSLVNQGTDRPHPNSRAMYR